jgi:hypothetical protein
MSPVHESYDKDTEACRLAFEVSTKIRDQLPPIISEVVASSLDPDLFAHVDAELIPSTELTVQLIVKKEAKEKLSPF